MEIDWICSNVLIFIMLEGYLAQLLQMKYLRHPSHHLYTLICLLDKQRMLGDVLFLLLGALVVGSGSESFWVLHYLYFLRLRNRFTLKMEIHFGNTWLFLDLRSLLLRHITIIPKTLVSSMDILPLKASKLCNFRSFLPLFLFFNFFLMIFL
jgi:hypothetical protein